MTNTQLLPGGNVAGVGNAAPVTVWRARARNLWRSLIPVLLGGQAIATLVVILLALQHPGTEQTPGEYMILAAPMFLLFTPLAIIGGICDHLANRIEGDYRN